MADISITFRHPTDSTVRRANIGSEATPSYLTEKLVEAGFLAPPAAGQPYSLVTVDGRRLLPEVPLDDAGIGSEAELQVVHEHQAAAPFAGVEV